MYWTIYWRNVMRVYFFTRRRDGGVGGEVGCESMGSGDVKSSSEEGRGCGLVRQAATFALPIEGRKWKSGKWGRQAAPYWHVQIIGFFYHTHLTRTNHRLILSHAKWIRRVDEAWEIKTERVPHQQSLWRTLYNANDISEAREERDDRVIACKWSRPRGYSFTDQQSWWRILSSHTVTQLLSRSDHKITLLLIHRSDTEYPRVTLFD